MGCGRSADIDETSRLERELVQELAETPPSAVARAVHMFSTEAVQLAGPAASLEELHASLNRFLEPYLTAQPSGAVALCLANWRHRSRPPALVKLCALSVIGYPGL